MAPPALKPIKEWQGHFETVWSCDIHPSGKWAVSGSWDGSVRRWDVSTGKHVAMMEGHRRHVYSTNFSADGSFILSAGEDGTVRQWDVQSGNELQKVQVLRHTPSAAEMGQLTNSFKMKKKTDNVIYCTAISHNTEWFLCGCSDFCLKHYKFGGNAGGAPGGEAGGAGDAESEGSGMKLLSSSLLHDSAIHCAALMRDDTHVLTGSGDSTLCFFDLQRSEISSRLKGSEAAIACCTPMDDNTFVSGGWDHHMRIYDLRAGDAPVRSFMAAGSHSAVTSCVTLQDGAYAVLGCSLALEQQEGDEHHSATGPGGALSVWDLRAGAMTSALAGHSNSVCCLAHDTASGVLVSGSSDNTLRSWQVGEAKAKSSSGICAVM
eukprot:g1263.t1